MSVQPHPLHADSYVPTQKAVLNAPVMLDFN